MIDFNRKGLAAVERIEKVIKHPNADRLDIVTINEWSCVASKGVFKDGDLCVYFEIDSILPQELEDKIFGADAKVKLKDHRVRTIKLRGAISQGLATPLEVLGIKSNVVVGRDLTKHFGVGKNVPTPKGNSVLNTIGKGTGTANENPNFDKMRKPVHFKKVGAFDEPVMITEKIHGTSFVAGWIERPNKTIAQKLNKFIFGKFQFCYRSMNVQLQGKDSLWSNLINGIFIGGTKEDLGDTLYGRMVLKYNLKAMLGYGEAISAEIYGSGIQANYTYGCADGEHKIAGFGFRRDGVELTPEDAHWNMAYAGVPAVPILFIGDFPDDLEKYTTGKSVLDPNTKVREGCVVNTLSGDKGWHGAALIKDINPAYLLMKDNTEFN